MTTVSGSGRPDYSDVEYVFEAHGSVLPPLREYVRDLWERRRFIQALAKAELRGPRSSTAIGELWGVLDPLFQGAIYWFLFAVIRGSQGGKSTDYLTVVIAGVFFFNYTRIALSDGGRSIIKGKGLMLNSTFPRALLPLASVYKGLLEFAPAVPVYIVFHLVLRAPIGSGVFMLPLLFVIQTAINIGLALVFSTLTVKVRDVSNLMNYVLRVLIFITPVIYPLEALTPTLQRILAWNPLFALFASYQQIISGGVPSFSYVAQSIFWAILFLSLGIRMFRKHERSFALYL